MNRAQRAGIVLVMARALAAASGEGRVATPALHAACMTLEPLRDVTPAEIGAILSTAGWQHRQWRQKRGNPGTRMRGYVRPEESNA